MKFKIGAKVNWKWLGRDILGVVKEVHFEAVLKSIKGKKIKPNGTKENPAYLVESNAGNLALKLGSELGLEKKSKKITPTMFSK